MLNKKIIDLNYIDLLTISLVLLSWLIFTLSFFI
jgi:hypothetical protein